MTDSVLLFPYQGLPYIRTSFACFKFNTASRAHKYNLHCYGLLTKYTYIFMRLPCIALQEKGVGFHNEGGKGLGGGGGVGIGWGGVLGSLTFQNYRNIH